MEHRYFTGTKDLEALKREYRALCKVNHPDNGGSAEMFKKITLDYNFQKEKIEKGAYTPIKVLRYSKTGEKWFDGIQISDIVEKVKSFLAENYSELLFEIEMRAYSFQIYWKQSVDIFLQYRIEKAIKEIVAACNLFECTKYPDEPLIEIPFFKFRGFEEYKKPVEEMEAWERCGYTCNWSLYY